MSASESYQTRMLADGRLLSGIARPQAVPSAANIRPSALARHHRCRWAAQERISRGRTDETEVQSGAAKRAVAAIQALNVLGRFRMAEPHSTGFHPDRLSPGPPQRKRKPQKTAWFSEASEWWAWQGLNLRPLRCQHSALPLSYTPTALASSCRMSRLQPPSCA